MDPKDTDKPEQDGKDRRDRLNNLADTLVSKRDKAVLYRASTGVERRWREDQEMLDVLTSKSGTSMIDYATGEAPMKSHGPVRSMAEINVLRGKCNVGSGRFEEILFPVDDKNYALEVTPVPTLVKGMKDERPVVNTETGQPMVEDGEPVTAAKVAAAKMAKANEAMEGMEAEIDDQLTESDYNGECRKVIRQSPRLGTGVLKGPGIVMETRRAWVKQTDEAGEAYVMKTVEEAKPKSKWVDCRNCYPDPRCGSDVKKSSYMWEYDEILPRDLRALIGVEGYFDDVIMEILKEEPQRIRVGYTRKEQRIEKDYLDRGNAFEYWEYNGEVDTEDLLSLGCECEDAGNKTLSACVILVNDRPIKVALNILDTMDIPYDFFQWEEVDGSPFGIGLVRMGMWMARVIKAAFRTMMDNGRDSAGVNVVIGQGIVPDDRNWEITGKKIWRANKDITDIRKAVYQFQIANNQAELQAIIELAIRFLDLETELPMMWQGEKAEMPETLGATNIILDSSNIGVRTRVKRWDDQVTKPHMTRYYNWNMMYNEKTEIKGDYNVVPRGASALLEKDQQTKALMQIVGLRGDGRFDKDVDWSKAVKMLCEYLKLDILKTDDQKKADEKAAQENPPQDPKIQVAQIRSQGELEKAKLNQSSDMSELKIKKQMADDKIRHEAALAELDREIQVMEFAENRGITLEKAKVELTKEASKQNLQRELSVVKASGPQVATPSVEPAGRAPEGQAYQK